ncbi:putative MutT/NUDIX-like protein [Actinoplanes capillaceus]|uniref:MutT/NUDIX-like protein n=1 Tax=Actinoplanes campanulatus TaxID=113559 RepID=A0ABQ3WZ16_9ACTN|nr:NUDIX domain-containing protein [Actinoplanes capillaceus]GID51522.1 putative MutT/NUDIX-like protein [Actinoplanes capillaceus]
MIRHLTASAVVLDGRGQVLVVRHVLSRKWLYPGGHVENEDPAHTAVRETHEETGLLVEVVAAPLFSHPAVTTHPPPVTIVEMGVRDAEFGEHRHIDMVYACRPRAGTLAAQPGETTDVRWVPLDDIAGLDSPAELADLIQHVTGWAGSLPSRTPSA